MNGLPPDDFNPCPICGEGASPLHLCSAACEEQWEASMRADRAERASRTAGGPGLAAAAPKINETKKKGAA